MATVNKSLITRLLELGEEEGEGEEGHKNKGKITTRNAVSNTDNKNRPRCGKL